MRPWLSQVGTRIFLPFSVGPQAGAPATTYVFTGPSTGVVNTASTNFSVKPNGSYTGTITITIAGGSIPSPVTFTWSNSSQTQFFTITPVQVGVVTLTPTNSGTLINQLPLTYLATQSAGSAVTIFPDPFAATAAYKGAGA